MNKYLILFSIIFVLLISISSVSAEGNFTELQEDIDSSGDVLEINQDYTYNNVSDSSFSEKGVLVNKSNYVVNGNNHTVNGKYSSKIFNITGSNITINNLNFININSLTNAIFIKNSNNILFTNCAFTNVSGYGVEVSSSNLTLNNISYDCNNSEGLCTVNGSNIYLSNSNFNDLKNVHRLIYLCENNSLSFSNCNFTNIEDMTICFSYLSQIYITHCVFGNLSSDYAPICSWGGDIFVEDSKFLNTFAGLTGGAIISKYGEKLNVKNCEFIHCFSTKNGGAIFADWVKNIAILNSSFVDCFSKFGGGLLVLMSNLVVNNSVFKNNKVEFDGAAIYTSYTNISISNSSFENNSCILDKELDSTNGGALYIDKAKKIKINKSKFINNKANKGGALFIYDSNNVNIILILRIIKKQFMEYSLLSIF